VKVNFDCTLAILKRNSQNFGVSIPFKDINSEVIEISRMIVSNVSYAGRMKLTNKIKDLESIISRRAFSITRNSRRFIVRNPTRKRFLLKRAKDLLR